ncbi:MAG: 50S ribosomal protein L5, partial [Methanobacteriales archaeon]|nr:50S ribosomal protein L5 [Methanobacteriales archaeon]
YRISRRRIQKRKVPRKHRVTREEAIKFMKEKFNVKIT